LIRAAAARNAATASTRVPAAFLKSEIEKHPWAEEFLLGRLDTASAPRGNDDPREPTAPVKEDAVFEDAWMSLAASREESGLVGFHMFSGTRFFTRVREEASASTGNSNVVVACEAARGVPRQWSGMYGLRVSSSFAVSRYGMDCAMALAYEWCARHTFFRGAAGGAGLRP